MQSIQLHAARDGASRQASPRRRGCGTTTARGRRLAPQPWLVSIAEMIGGRAHNQAAPTDKQHS